MTLKEVYELFIANYKRECLKRGIKEVRIPIGILASDISRAQQDIQRRKWVVETSYDLSLTANTNTYNLPSNFGRQKIVTIGDIPLKEVTSRMIQEADSLYGNALVFAIIVGNPQKIMFYPAPSLNTTAKIYFYPDFNFYSPSGDTEDWGSFDGEEFSGNLMLPDRYINAVILYLMALWFNDFELKYERELNSIQRIRSLPDTIEYNIGWDKDRSIREGGSVQQVSAASDVEVPYDSFYKFSMVEGSDPSEIDSHGFLGDINVSYSNGVISIVSNNSEFAQPGTVVDLEPSDLNYSITPGLIQIYTYSGHKPITGTIKVW